MSAQGQRTAIICHLVQAASMQSNVVSAPLDILSFKTVGVQLVWTFAGAPEVLVSVEFSNDASHWNLLESPPADGQITLNGELTALWSAHEDIGYKYMRILAQVVNPSSDILDVYVCAKS